MTNTIKIKFDKDGNQYIEIDRTFAKKAANAYSEEYCKLQEVRRDYPELKVRVKKIKKNSDQEHYGGLTYSYMESYIKKFESADNVQKVLKEFADKKFISESLDKPHRYPKVKKWFLKRYPEIIEFGLKPIDDNLKEAS